MSTNGSAEHFAYLASRRRNRITGLIAVSVIMTSIVWYMLRSSRTYWLQHATSTELERAAKQDPGDDEVGYRYAYTLVEAGHEDQALGIMRRIVTRHPGSAFYRFALAKVYDELGQLAPAADDYRRAIALDPSLAPAHAALASIYAQARLATDAVAEFEKAKALAPGTPIDETTLAKELEVVERKNDALALANSALARSPMADGAYDVLTDIGIERRDFDTAEIALRHRLLLTAMYSVIPVRMDLIRLLIARHRAGQSLEDALELAEDGFTIQGETPAYYALYAEVLALVGRRADARKAIAGGLKLNPNDKDCLAQLMRLDEADGRKQEAAALAARLATCNHRPPEVVELQRRLAAQPAAQETRRALIQALRRAGDGAAAAEECHTLLAAVPGDTEAAALLDTCRAEAIRQIPPPLSLPPIPVPNAQ